MNRIIKALKERKFEIVFFLLWLAAAIVVTAFHEPWYDEAQAWLIARDASFKTILFETTHTEGHPPLWQLLLSVFAKTGMPYEPSLKTLQLLITSAAVLLILFKSPFPKLIRISLPFGFFIFYNTAVIARPYSITMLAFILMAMTYNRRDEKPVPFVLSVSLLCLSHMFGIMMGGMICFVWVVKIIAENKKNKTLDRIYSDRRFLPLLLLFIFACLLIVDIAPGNDQANAQSAVSDLFTADRVITSLKEFALTIYQSTFSLFDSVDSVVINVFMSAVIISALIYYERKKDLKWEFFAPYLVFAVFHSIFWSFHYHSVFVVYLLIYFFWFSYTPEDHVFGDLIKKRLSMPLLRKLLAAVGVLLWISPIIASIGASVTEVRYHYQNFREMSAFIKEHDLSDKIIFENWTDSLKPQAVMSQEQSEDEKQAIEKQQEIEERKQFDIKSAVVYELGLLPYFDHNILANVNVAQGDFSYAPHKNNPDNITELWHDIGVPDVLINVENLEDIFSEDELKDVNYALVYRNYYSIAWKLGSKGDGYDRIWVRRELLDECGLEEIPYDHNTVI